MTLKLLMALTAVAGSAWIGHVMAGCALRRTRTLANLLEGLEMLRVQALDRLRPLPEALRAGSCPIFQRVGQAMDSVGSAEAWRQTRQRETRRGGLLDCLTAEDLEALEALFDGLGISGRSGQSALLDGARKRFIVLEKEAREQGRDKDRLYTTLGLLGGLTLTVLLL